MHFCLVIISRCNGCKHSLPFIRRQLFKRIAFQKVPENLLGGCWYYLYLVIPFGYLGTDLVRSNYQCYIVEIGQYFINLYARFHFRMIQYQFFKSACYAVMGTKEYSMPVELYMFQYYLRIVFIVGYKQLYLRNNVNPWYTCLYL